MRNALLCLVVSLGLVGGASPDVQIGRHGDRLDVTATTTPVAQVLDRLGREIGMEVSYDGNPPRDLVTVNLQGRTALGTVLGVLEGLGLNYALYLDPTGARVTKLVIVTAKPEGAKSQSAAPQSRADRMRQFIEQRRGMEEPAEEFVPEEPIPEEMVPPEGVAPPPDTSAAQAPYAAEKPEPAPPPPQTGPIRVVPMYQPNQPEAQPEATPPPFNP